MTSLLRLIAVFSLFLSFIGCSEASVTHADPQNLVAFKVPAGWAERDKSSGIRFGRADAPAERTVLSVLARPRDPKIDIAAQRAITHAQIQQQGFSMVVDRTQQINGWMVWESVMDATRGKAGPMMHTFQLFSQDLQVTISLIAEKSDYPKYQKDLLAVVQSLRKR
jgi:hypothetical protein